MNRKMRMRLAVAAGVGAGALGIAAPALATVTNVGGGVWDYGTSTSTVHSYYVHGSKCHGSTAVGTSLVRSPDTAAGKWARAATSRKEFGNEAFWRNSC